MNPTVNYAEFDRRVSKKVERAFDRLNIMPATGTQAVLRCNGIVCKEGSKYYVETGLVNIVLPKFGDEHFAAKLAGLWVN